jgi:hypothetical protein
MSRIAREKRQIKMALTEDFNHSSFEVAETSWVGYTPFLGPSAADNEAADAAERGPVRG